MFRRRLPLAIWSCFFPLAVAPALLNAQEPAAPPQKTVVQFPLEPVTERTLIRSIFSDQKHLWSSPFRLKPSDSYWLVPSAVGTAWLIHRDVYLYDRLQYSGGDGSNSRLVSDAGLVAFGGVAAGLYAKGKLSNDEHATEAALLSTSAFLNTLPFTFSLKYALGRQRPNEPGSRGEFGMGGDSMPSFHAASSWAVASVLAHEYPGVLTKIGAYGLASAISISRVTGRRHFPSDVVVGSALGWAIGREVYRRHHQPQDFRFGKFVSCEELHPLEQAASYVPLEHWGYEAVDRLAALGYVKSAFSGLRPWTRMEFARLIREARSELGAREIADYEAERMFLALQKDFAEELERFDGKPYPLLRLESAYSRITGISGLPLADDYHFGETITNDYGRPVREGVSNVTGFSGWYNHRRWAFYFRGEYQYGPDAAPLSLPVRTEIGRVDRNIPIEPALAIRETNRFRILDAYMSYNLRRWQLSFGTQSLNWGPAESGAFMMSNNAEPVLMFRVSRTSPAVLPGFLAYLGPLRTEIFFGQLAGQKYVRTANGFFSPPLERQPLIDGFKLSFKPTPNFEYGVSVTTMFAGPGFPLTARTFLRSLGFSNAFPGEPNDPGDRRTGFDFKYRIPGLRKWLTLYNDSMADDEISPLGFPRRSAQAPGLYIPQIPKLNRLDLRAEGYYTDLPGLRATGFFYSNFRFISGYTNRGNLLGHPVGRQGSGYRVASTYHFTPQNTISASFRHNAVSPQFIQNGGSLSDYSVQWRWRIRSEWETLGRMQYERWKFPVIAASPQTNFSTMVQLTYWPKRSPRVQ
jgi:membrane-associated phospholipid phosphatase